MYDIYKKLNVKIGLQKPSCREWYKHWFPISIMEIDLLVQIWFELLRY